jgi:hypothetical protein
MEMRTIVAMVTRSVTMTIDLLLWKKYLEKVLNLTIFHS